MLFIKMNAIETSQLLQMYKPILYLNSQETYFPISIESIIKNSSLIENAIQTTNKEGNTIIVGGETTIGAGKVTSSQLYDISKTKYNGQTGLKTIYLNWPDKLNNGVAPSELNTVPIYGRVIDKGSFYEISYIFNFAYNAAFKVLGLQDAGQHYGDLEHITIYVKKPVTGQFSDIIKVMYGAHGSADGRWVDGNMCPQEDGHLVVYLAKGSHATYPTEGLIFRLGGAANDQTDKGYKWIPSTVIPLYKDSDSNFEKSTMGWLYFAGRLGNDGISSLADKYWWNNGEPTQDAIELSPPRILVGTEIIAYHTANYLLIALICYGIYLGGTYQQKLTVPFYYGVVLGALLFLAYITKYIIRKVA